MVEDVEISLDFSLDQTAAVRLDAAPVVVPDTTYALFPFLNLGADGVIPFATTLSPNPESVVEGLPGVSESSFFYLGGAFSTAADGSLSTPFSLTLFESGKPFAEGVDLGPFVNFPEQVVPKPNALLETGTFSWIQGGARPDVTLLNVTDTRVIEGCCCQDLDLNGVCDEANEPVQCGGDRNSSTDGVSTGPVGFLSTSYQKCRLGFRPSILRACTTGQCSKRLLHVLPSRRFRMPSWSPLFSGRAGRCGLHRLS